MISAGSIGTVAGVSRLCRLKLAAGTAASERVSWERVSWERESWERVS